MRVWLALLISMSVCGAAGTVSAESAEPLNFDQVRLWAMQDHGRVKPVDTYARETVKTITGKQHCSPVDPKTGKALTPSGDPVDTLFSMMFQPEQWASTPAVRIKSVGLKRQLRLNPGEQYFTLDVLKHNEVLPSLSDELMQKEQLGEKNLTEVQSGTMDLISQVNLMESLGGGEPLTLVPPEGAAEAAEEKSWSSILEPAVAGEALAQDLKTAFSQLRTAYLAGDGGQFAQSVATLTELLRKVSPAHYPSLGRLQLEVTYNRTKPFVWALALYLAAFVAWVIAMGVKRAAPVAWALLGLGLTIHTLGFIVRTILSGRAPIANMYESMVLMAWGIVALSILLELLLRSRYFVLSASLVGGMLLLMAHVLPVDSSIGVLLPVLRNNRWLVIHVVTVMLSYSAFAEAWALGHVMLGRIILHPRDTTIIQPMCRFVYRTLQVGVLLLAAGTILGAMWANVAWGRYWGWDPKETWALITLLGYLALLHVRYTNWLGNFGFAAGSVLAFMLVVMCYYGVNFVLPQGLHSYGSGSGGVQYAVMYVAADLAFVLVAILRWRGAKAAH